MSQIKNKNTRPEMKVRKWLWANGYRYRLHSRNLPGKPDIVLSKYNTVIFVHGCFWHRHGCRYTTFPATRQEFWKAKFKENTERDKRNYEQLLNAGWNICTIWECEIKSKDNTMEKKLSQFLDSL